MLVLPSNSKGRMPMIRNCLLLIATMVMVLSLAACGSADKTVRPESEIGEEVQFPDPILDGVIRKATGKSEGPIYDTDLRRITALRGADKGITDLTGLEYCTRLENIWLDGNEVKDISQLANLTNLTTLNLEDNQIKDVSPLANLTNLTSLKLSMNQITDISPLVSLTKLTNLSIWGNDVSDISIVAELTNLKTFWAWDNQISDISVVVNLQQINDIRFHKNNITDASPLLEITGWSEASYITLEYNPLDDRSLNEVIPKLKEKIRNVYP